MYRDACQDLIRNMSKDFTQFTDQEKVTQYTSDSGMEDGAISPVSSVGSENGVYRSQSPQSPSDTSHPILPVKPQVLTPSESSAFSKINKWTSTYPASFGNFPSMCPSSGIGYMPGFFVSPWIAESFQRNYPLPPAPMLYGSQDAPPSKSPPLVATDNSLQSPEKRAFYHVDPRIPFTNYFMNLTKVLQKSEDASKTQEDREAVSKDEKPVITEKHECFRYECSEATKRTPSPQPSMSALEDSTDDIKDSKTSPEIPSIHSIDSLRIMNTHGANKTALPVPSGVFPVPGTVDHIGSYPSLAPSTSMLPLVGGMGLTPSTAMFHPAFLQMAGIGGKRMHHPDKPTPVKKYKCDVCGKAFSRSNTLVTHKRIHTGDKPFKCEVCGRAFRQPGNLTRHRLTHTTVKPYVCPQCNKAFNRASNLHTHMRTHTNFKPFVCPYCGKGFHQKIDMKIHCYTHTGQRPHRCDVCGKGFTLASTLNTHRRIHFDAGSFPAPSFTATATVVNS